MIQFHKYVAAGNDFIIFNNWDEDVHIGSDEIIQLCDRRFGIGADGVLLLTPSDESDFRMNYYNADGSRGEMCGNGARSLVKFAFSQKKIGLSGTFKADDGFHQFEIDEEQVQVEILVNDELHKQDIPTSDSGFINTGVPHLITPVKDCASENLLALGESLNPHSAFPEGTNVNIVEQSSDALKVRTWERGVNMETLACGTGATAVAIFANKVWRHNWPISLSFKGGDLKVDYRENRYWLTGDATLVFTGHLT